jgi:hypothetical protein
MNDYFKSDEELLPYLRLNVSNSDYCGVFKTKEFSRKYFAEVVGLRIEDQEFIDATLSNSFGEHNTSVISDSDASETAGYVKTKRQTETTYLSKTDAIQKLQNYNSRTSHNKIANLLSRIFEGYGTTNGNHWLWIANNYPPRSINRVLKIVFKRTKRIRNPAALFTSLIKNGKGERKHWFRRRKMSFGNNSVSTETT